jgi:hypothetical protein
MMNHDCPHLPQSSPEAYRRSGLGSRSRGRRRAGAGVLGLAALALVGCAGYGLAPEQIKEMSAAQSSACVTGASWNGAPLVVHYTFFGGKSTGTAGGGGKATCGGSEVVFQNDGKAPAKPASAP